MKKRLVSLVFTAFMSIAMVGCAGNGSAANTSNETAGAAGESATEAADTDISEPETKADEDGGSDNFHIGIVTGSYSQSEDDRRGAEAFMESFGEENVTLAIYPDNFTEELDTTIQIMVDLTDDPDMKAIVVSQAVDGTTEAFRRIKEKRPDIICIAGEPYEDLSEIEEVADLVVTSDFVARGYLMIRSAHELGCDTFVHISLPRHLEYESVARQIAVMKAACEEFGISFEMETAPDPTTDVGVPGAQSYILEHAPEWVEKYGTDTAFFCTNDAHTEPLIKVLMEKGGYFIEADLPSPLLGYPGALGLDLIQDSGDFKKILSEVEEAVVNNGGAGRFGTWAYSYGYTVSAGLAEHAKNVLSGDSKLTKTGDLAKAFSAYSPGAEWNGTKYIDAKTGEKSENTVLVYQDTYIFGDPGYYMGSTAIDVPEKYFTVE